MPKKLSERARLDAVSRLTADLRSTDAKALDRLRSLINTAISEMPTPQKAGAIVRSVGLGVDAETRKSIRELELDRGDETLKPLEFERRDLREETLEARLAGPLTALAATERLGPFDVDGGRVFFEFYRRAKRFELWEKGAAAPAFVLTAARRPRAPRRGPLRLQLPKGTIWIRGDLIGAGLPAGAYAGITISGGEVVLPRPDKIGDDNVVVRTPLEATLTLRLSAEKVAAKEGGCRSGASVQLPELTLNFGPSGLQIQGGRGKAKAWRQQFNFAEPTGSLGFLAPLWTLLIGYRVEPDRFNAAAIKSAVADFRGNAQVAEAALTLPVVVANPSALGAASVSPGWALRLRGLGARWYKPDDRFHRFDAWMGIGAAGTLIFAPQVRPLDAPVESVYRLWDLAESPGHRLPWNHNYDTAFLFSHTCHVANGETLLTTGSANVRLDRPFETNGRPVETLTTVGVMHQHKGAGPVEATLGALTGDADKTQFALRNAVVWATRAAVVLASGPLTDRQFLNSGTSHVFFGVFSWAPTLPDPYVGNFRLCQPDLSVPRALTAARIRWTAPDDVETTFIGNLGPPLVCDKPSSPGDPVPAPQTDLNPDIGTTQTEQDKLYLSEEGLADWKSAQKREFGARQKRIEKARRQNEKSERDIGGYLDKALGRTPPVLMLDVSTNQDLLGVALWGGVIRDWQPGTPAPGPVVTATAPPNLGLFQVEDLAVISPVEALRLVTLPQIQWEPVRTLDADQDILTLGWFPTPLASATDGGATVLGARHQKLVPVIPDSVVEGTQKAFEDGSDVVFRTTLPFGIVTVVEVTPTATPPHREADQYEITRPEFPAENAIGGYQITAKAEGDADPAGGISPTFSGMTRQLINGVDLATGVPLGLSVLGSTLDPTSNTEAIFNNDMSANPRVPVTRFDLSGYGGSNFSKWENPFALFAETSKTQFQVMVGRTALEIIKVASVLHPWGIRVTREVIVERQSGGGVIRRDTGWQAASPGIFDYRYTDTVSSPTPAKAVADYVFDSGIFKGFHNVRSIRPAPGVDFSHGADTFVPYYFDADLGLEGLSGRTPANGILGWLQTKRSGLPASEDALEALIEAQGPIGGPIDTWLDFGASKLPFRAQRIEVGLADDAGDPLFVATVRGVPKFPKTGSWSVVRRQVASVPPDGGEAVPVAESRGAPIIRRYPVKFDANDTASYDRPRLKPGSTIGDWRIADAEDLLTPAAPQNDYGILQGTPTHAFLFPRPYALGSGSARLRSSVKPELADVIARSTSKGAFPPPQNAIQLNATYHFDVGSGGSMALSSPVTVVGHPTALRLSGSDGHGSKLIYDDATLSLQINANDWSAEFTGMKIWSDIAGMETASGAGFRVVGSTTQRPQMTDIETLVHPVIDGILTYLPIFGARELLGPIDLGASNAKHEIKVEVGIEKEVPENGWSIGGASLKLKLGTTQKTGFDIDTGGIKASAAIKAGFKGEFPILSVGAASVYIITQLDVKFSIASVSGTVTSEKFDLIAFAGIGIKGSVGPFEAYAFLGVGFVMTYDIPSDTAKYGGLVRFEAGVSVAIVKVKLTAELKGLVYKDAAITKCDYSGSVKLQVDIFLIISISATYSVTGTKELE